MEFINKNKYLNKQEYNLSNTVENVEMIVYAALSFFIPLFIGHPQIIVGVLVNSALVLSAMNLKGYKLLPVILLPSLGVLTRGVIFGPLTIYLLIMIPFIWISNTILVVVYKKFNLEKKVNRFFSLIFSSVLKSAFLFTIAYVFVSLEILPSLFLATMGLFQLYTAIAGGVIAFGIQYGKKKITA